MKTMQYLRAVLIGGIIGGILMAPLLCAVSFSNVPFVCGIIAGLCLVIVEFEILHRLGLFPAKKDQ